MRERGNMSTMGRRAGMKWLRTIGVLSLGLLGLLVFAGCAKEFMVLHSETGEVLIIARRSHTTDSCVAKLHEDANRMGVTFRYVHVRGTTVGRSLLWPFEPGYACEGAIGPEQRPSGSYPPDPRILAQPSTPLS
jgi:hypothetical protein